MRIIQLNKKWWTIWPELSRNQILLAITLHMRVKEPDIYNECVQKIYGTKKNRRDDDSDVVIPFYNKWDDFNHHIEATRIKDWKKQNMFTAATINDAGGYYKLKTETFLKMLNMNKNELLVVLWFLKTYNVEDQRIWSKKIHKILKEIFRISNPSKNRQLFLNTLDKINGWEYCDDSYFLGSYRIQNAKITFNLDIKKHKRKRR